MCPMFLTCTDLDGNPKEDLAGNSPGPVNTVQQPQVVIPLSDSRTGSVTVSMYELVAAAITPGDTAFKIAYRNPRGTEVLLLNGIVVLPTYDFDAGTIQFTVHDPTIRLKRRYLDYAHVSIMLGLNQTIVAPPGGGDPGVNPFTGGSFNGIASAYGIPVDGRGLRVIVYDAGHGTKLRGGAVPFGIRKGNDTATPQPFLVFGVPPPGVGGLQNDGVTDGVGFTGTIVAGVNTITGVDFTAATNADGSTPTATDIRFHARIDGPGIPAYCTVLSMIGTTLTMSENATVSGTFTNAFTTEDAIYAQLTRGDCCYDDVLELVQAAGGFECDWVPVDSNHLGVSGAAWLPGQMCELHTADRIGIDSSQGNADGNPPIVFVHGENGFHLTSAPDADQLCTFAVEVGPGGPLAQSDYFNKSVKISSTAGQYGYWEDWVQASAAGQGDSPISNALLANRADAILTAFQHPPEFLTATIDSDKIGIYSFPDDYGLGDTVTVYARKGHVSKKLDARITQVTLTQVDQDGKCQIDLQMVPHLVAGGSVSLAGGGGTGGSGGGGGGGGGGSFAPDIWDGRLAGNPVVYDGTTHFPLLTGFAGVYGFFESCSAHNALTVVAAPDSGPDYWFNETVADADHLTHQPGTSVNNASSANSIGLFDAATHKDHFIRFQLWVPSGFPVINSYLGGGSAFLQVYETYGAPFGGAAPFAIDFGDIGHVGYNELYWTDHTGTVRWRSGPITTNARHTLVIHENSDSNAAVGFIEIMLDGVQQTMIGGGTKRFCQTIVPGVNDGGLNTCNFDNYYKVGCSMVPPTDPLTILHGGMMVGTTFASVGSGS